MLYGRPAENNRCGEENSARLKNFSGVESNCTDDYPCSIVACWTAMAGLPYPKGLQPRCRISVNRLIRNVESCVAEDMVASEMSMLMLVVFSMFWRSSSSQQQTGVWSRGMTSVLHTLQCLLKVAGSIPAMSTLLFVYQQALFLFCLRIFFFFRSIFRYRVSSWMKWGKFDFFLWPYSYIKRDWK